MLGQDVTDALKVAACVRPRSYVFSGNRGHKKYSDKNKTICYRYSVVQLLLELLFQEILNMQLQILKLMGVK